LRKSNAQDDNHRSNKKDWPDDDSTYYSPERNNQIWLSNALQTLNIQGGSKMRAKRNKVAAFVEFCKNDTDAGNTYKI
jgi:hypothetical protein